MRAKNPTVVITGASRSIGLEFTRQYLERGAMVFATCRNPERAEGLQTLKEQHPDTCIPVQMDVMDDGQIQAAARAVSESADQVDLLINNAGIYGENEAGLESISSETLLRVLHVDAVGPVMVTRYFLPLLRKSDSAKVASLTSGAGLLKHGLPKAGGSYSYGAGKAALHKVLQSMAADLATEGIVSVGMAPGFVLTDMTRGSPRTPPLLPEESVAGMIRVMDGLTREDVGRFLAWDGHECEWTVEN